MQPVEETTQTESESKLKWWMGSQSANNSGDSQFVLLVEMQYAGLESQHLAYDEGLVLIVVRGRVPQYGQRLAFKLCLLARRLTLRPSQ